MTGGYFGFCSKTHQTALTALPGCYPTELPRVKRQSEKEKVSSQKHEGVDKA